MYRHNALDKHQELVAAHTEDFQRLSKEARDNYDPDAAELVIDESLGDIAKGVAIFNQNCASCHKENEKLVGPPVVEMAGIYSSDEIGLKNWIKAPGKKRADMPQMPGFPQLSENDLVELSKYILSINK